MDGKALLSIQLAMDMDILQAIYFSLRAVPSESRKIVVKTSEL